MKLTSLQNWLITRDSGWTILVRLLIGLVVFFPEGIQKLMFPAIMGPAGSPDSAFHGPASPGRLSAGSRSCAAR